MSVGRSATSAAATTSNRPAFSCTPCRTRKVRCDRRRNCGNCQRRGEECIWPKLAWAIDDTTITPESNNNELQARVERLESIIFKAGLDRIDDDEIVSNTLPRPPSASSLDDQVAIDDLLEPNEVTHHDHFDHQIISRKRRRADAKYSLSKNVDEVQRSLRKVQQVLPSRARCDYLVKVYFERVEWIHHVIHRPTFQDWYTNYWEVGVGRCDTSFHSLALLFSMLCLALHFDDQLSMPDSAGEKRYFDASCEVLRLGKYLSQHSIVVLQTLIMQGLWLNDMGHSEMHHANLGLAIRVANVMGLSRLDAQSSDRVLPSRINSEVDSFSIKEMKRRIYWSLVCQDCYTASSCNFTYLIHSSQIKVDVFTNVDDDELMRIDRVLEQDDGEGIVQLIKERGLKLGETTSSYHIAKIPFAETARDFVDLYNANEVTYNAILQLDEKTRRCYEALPEYLQYRNGNPKKESREIQWQRLFLNITLHNRIMRLHRSFLTRGYTDPEYGYSVEATLKSAKALLQLITEGQQISFPGQRWWVVLIHIFTAGVALCIDYHYHISAIHSNSTAQLLQNQERKSWVQNAMSQLNNVRAFSDAANRAVEILETLFNQVETRSTQNTPQQSPPEIMPEYAPDWNRLFQQALNGTEDYTTDHAILETIQTFALGSWPS